MLHYRSPGRRPGRCSDRPLRRRVIALVIGGGGMLGVLIAGLVLSVVSVLGAMSDGPKHGTAAPGTGATPPSAEEWGNRANRGSVDVTTASRGEDPRSEAPTPMVLPASTAMGPRGVVTGYPRSAEGAVAQLAAIDVAILQESQARAGRTVRVWSVPTSDGDALTSTSNAIDVVRSLLPRAELGRPVPWMAAVLQSAAPTQYKVCVLFALEGKGQFEAAIHCEVMVWDDGHWAIKPDQTSHLAADIPGSPSRAYEAGFRPLQGPVSLNGR